MLHTYPYKETSLIVEAFTRRFGRVALLARGARRPRSAMRGVLLSFQPLRLGWSGSAELAQPDLGRMGRRRCRRSRGRALMCGFYLNELLLRLLPREDPHEALFDAYGEALARLARRRCLARCCAASRSACSPSSAMRRCSTATRRAARRSSPTRLYAYEPDRGPVR